VRRFRLVGSDQHPSWPPATQESRRFLNQPIPKAEPSGWTLFVEPPLQPLLRLRTQPLAGQRPPGQRWAEGLWRSLSLVLALVLALPALPALASPGLCVGPVCGDEFSRSALYHWQLRLRVNDQQGHRERLVVDCRTGAISPQQGLVERGYASAVARRACRLVAEGMADPKP